MNLTTLLEQGLHIYLLAPFLSVIVFTAFYKSNEANYFLLNISRVLYPALLGFCGLKLIGSPQLPPGDIYQGIVIIFFVLCALFFVRKKERYIVQALLLTALTYLHFQKQFQANWIFVVSIIFLINILFLLLYSLSTGKKPLVLKIFHGLCILAIAFWAYKLNQPKIFYIAILCSSSIVTVSLLKIIFFGGVVPNFSKQIIDIGIPLILLWLLINMSGVLYDYISPYISVDGFYN